MEMDNAKRRLASGVPIDDVDTETIVKSIDFNGNFPRIIVGLHITALNAFVRKELTSQDFDLVNFIYPDGWSVQLLAKVRGAKHVRRIATTDLVPLITSENEVNLRRVAFIGGTPEVSELAKLNWLKDHAKHEVLSIHGYHDDWTSILVQLRGFNPQLVLVGMGMPRELMFLTRHYDELPVATYVTCGGYLKILAKTENRSPKIIQFLRLEWAYRLLFHPFMTANRYFFGVIAMAKLLFTDQGKN